MFKEAFETLKKDRKLVQTESESEQNSVGESV